MEDRAMAICFVKSFKVTSSVELGHAAKDVRRQTARGTGTMPPRLSSYSFGRKRPYRLRNFDEHRLISTVLGVVFVGALLVSVWEIAF